MGLVNKLLVIVGPTAVGKTTLSLQLANILGGEIISADSRLFYRGMDIGTAKPTLVERSTIRHHLLDICEPDQTVTLGEYQRLAYRSIDEVLDRDRLPILVGGKAGGRIASGQHLVYGKDTPLANLYVAMLKAFGCSVDRFADSTGALPGVLV